jgi:hypothetical protein
MQHEHADRLAAVVRAACAYDVEAVPDGEFFAVRILNKAESASETWTLCDEADWEWLRERTSS